MTPRISSIHPLLAIEGGRVSIRGQSLPVDGERLPEVLIGGMPVRTVRATTRGIDVIVPHGVEGGRQPVQIDGVSGETPFIEIGTVLATGLHQVDSPAFGLDGSLYVTYSGSRDERAPVSIYRVTPDGAVEPFASVSNPTSLACGPDGALYVSSRFQGVVYRLEPGGSPAVFASELGVPFGLVFRAGVLFVGDRSGAIHRVDQAGHSVPFASLPPSVAACHLTLGPDQHLYATTPTLAPRDRVYRIDESGRVEALPYEFGRPQGLAFDAHAHLHVVEALAGSSGIYRLAGHARRELVVAGREMIGVTFDSHDRLVVASSQTVYRFGGTPRLPEVSSDIPS